MNYHDWAALAAEKGIEIGDDGELLQEVMQALPPAFLEAANSSDVTMRDDHAAKCVQLAASIVAVDVNGRLQHIRNRKDKATALMAAALRKWPLAIGSPAEEPAAAEPDAATESEEPQESAMPESEPEPEPEPAAIDAASIGGAE